MERNLPIQLVETRGVQDIFHKEGGGGDRLPKWYSEGNIRQNAQTMRVTLTEVGNIFAERARKQVEGLPVIVKATLHEDATAKSYRGNARSVFTTRRKRNIIGATDPRELIIKIDNSTDLNTISRNVQENNLNKLSKDKRIGIASITGLSLFSTQVEDGIENECVKVRLIDYLDHRLNEWSRELFLTQCQKLGIDIKTTSFSHESRLYYINSLTDENRIALSTMDSVLSVRRMPYFEITTSPEPFYTDIEVKRPNIDDTYPEIGILDSGVANIPHLTEWINEEQNTANLDNEDIRKGHGTAVASILNYGDELLGIEATRCAPAKITSFIVNTVPTVMKISEFEMIEHIKSAIENNPHIKVWNLSQGSDIEISDTCFSDFAIEIDALQKKHNVLICKSSGNTSVYNKTKICQGADSIMSLVVGSVTHRNDGANDAPLHKRSFFSRFGPGPNYLIKPDLVHYGGNEIQGVHTLSEFGYQSNYLKGTSFSTPRITSLAANLAYRLNRNFDPTLIKALLIHNAHYPGIDNTDSNSLLQELGHGVPQDIDTILYNDPNEFTMIWQPTFDTDDYQIQDIPFPQSMIDEQGHFYGEITVTVVSDPVLKGTEGSEYCQSEVEVLLQTYDGIQYVPLNAVGNAGRIRNSERLINPQNVLVKTIYGKKSFKSNVRSERTLTESGLKYQPIKKYHVNLEQATPTSKDNYLTQNKRWCLKMRAMYRDATISEKEIDGVHETAKATVIITIRDPKERNIAYNECMASLAIHNFPHSNVMVRQHIEVNNQ